MTLISFTDEELGGDQVVEPAWYVLDIQAHRTWSPAKSGTSNNCYFDCVIVKNADTDDTHYAGVPVELRFNDQPKAKGFLKAFLLGLGVNLKSNTNYNLYSAVGKQVEVFIENSEWQGRISNKVNKYRVPRN